VALMKVLIYPDRFLRKKVDRVENVDDEIRTLLEDMAETMYAAPGVGLAGTQVGVNKRVIVVDFPVHDEDDTDESVGWAEDKDGNRLEGLLSIVNPEIKDFAKDEITWEEGCLSIPGVYEDVKRPVGVTVTGLDPSGKEIIVHAVGFPAVELQHEIDHLDGILFIDRLMPVKRRLVKKRLDKAVAEGNYPPPPSDE